MQSNKTRLMAISGATLALVVATTAAVSAHPGGNDRGRGLDGGKAGAGAKMRGGMQGGMLGDRAGLRGAMRGAFDDFERRETTIQTADGTTVHRVEQGTVDSASDAGLTFSLASGESVTVAIDDDTQSIAFSEQEVTSRRGLNRSRMAPTEIEINGIEAGSEVVVWSDAEDGTGFVAQRVVVQPDAADAGADVDATEAVEDAAAAPVTDA